MIAQLADALRSLRRVLGNPEIRRVELAWMLGWASEWPWLVALWVYAFNAAAVVEARLVGA